MLWFFDIATRRTGWAAGNGDARPVTGVFEYDYVGDDMGLLAEMWHRDLNVLKDRFGLPTVIGYERPILMEHDRITPLRKIYGMGMQLELWGRQRGVTVCEVGLKDIKKRLTGNGNAKKPEVAATIARLGIELPKGDGRLDAADAAGGWIILVDHYEKQFQPRWDAALYRSKGAALL